MARIVIVGAGIGGVPMAYEMKEHARPEDEVIVVSDSKTFHFVPSNPWVAVKWRKPEEITIELEPYLKKKGIEFIPSALKTFLPDENRMVLENGTELEYDYVVIATGPRLAFDEIPGLGPKGQPLDANGDEREGNTQSICHVDHAASAADEWQRYLDKPGPMVVGAAQFASCFGPAYEFAFIADTDLRKKKIRDKAPITFVTAEPHIGHLGLGGVGDSKGMLESELRKRDIKWITNAKVEKIEENVMHVVEVDDNGDEKRRHELPFDYSMMIPAFTGIEPFRKIEGLVNPRGFILIDEHQRNPKYGNVFSVGVCVAIPPVEVTPVPTGAPKTGYMIESMVTATAHNIRALLDEKEPKERATWNAICLADMGNTGVAFVAIPQMPPRNVAWMRGGKWVHLAKVAFEKYFLRKVKKGMTEPYYERAVLSALGIKKLKDVE